MGDDGGSEMSVVYVVARRPVEPLRPFVRRFLVVESATSHRDEHLPETGLVAAFGYRGECVVDGGVRAPRAAVTGLWDRVRAHDHSGDHAVVIVSFTPTGAAALLRQPLDAFANRTTDLDAAVGSRSGVARLLDRLHDARDRASRVDLVERFLLDHLDGGPDALVAAAVRRIEQTRGRARIADLARQVGLGQSALERRFRRHVGVSPRRFASIVRLRHVVRLHDAGLSLTDVAHAAGYHDQPHFVRDFRRFAGRAPGAFFAQDRLGQA
jgi:AraC-like DNA-binding protein